MTRYEIRDAEGRVVAVHVREDFIGADGKPDKKFRWELPDGTSGLNGLPVASIPLYGAHLVAGWDPEASIIVTEGEKKADALLGRGYCALATVTGAASVPSPESLGALRGRDATLWRDFDDPGRKHMAKVATVLNGIAHSMRLLEWGEQEGDDAFDFFERGGTEGQLDQMLAEAPEVRFDDVPADWTRPGDGLAGNPLPTARVVTSLPTLNEATRGGLPTGSATLHLGAPDGGKTGLAMTEADDAERQGFTVIHLSPDGGREAAELRWGQMMGFDRVKLEERDPAEMERFRGVFASRNIFLPDPDALDGTAPKNTLARVVDQGRIAFPGRTVFLLIDSLQTIKPDPEVHDSPRMRVDAVLGLIRKAASTPGWLVSATSQTNRASRRHKNEDDNTDPMTAGMESGAIEHTFDLMIYLDGDATGEDGVRVRITKNKPGAGRKPKGLRLRWDRERARFAELDGKLLESETVSMMNRDSEKLRSEVIAIITKHPGDSTTAVSKRAGKRMQDVWNVLDELVAQGLVRFEKRGVAKFWFPTDSTLPAEDGA